GPAGPPAPGRRGRRHRPERLRRAGGQRAGRARVGALSPQVEAGGEHGPAGASRLNLVGQFARGGWAVAPRLSPASRDRMITAPVWAGAMVSAPGCPAPAP